MDRGRPPQQERLEVVPAVSTDPIAPSTRVKPFATPSKEIPSFSAFQAQTSKVNSPSPVKRKPLPLSASPIVTKIPLSSGGRLVAVGEEDSTIEPQNPSLRQVPWLPTPTSGSPPLLVRDLDQ